MPVPAPARRGSFRAGLLLEEERDIERIEPRRRRRVGGGGGMGPISPSGTRPHRAAPATRPWRAASSAVAAPRMRPAANTPAALRSAARSTTGRPPAKAQPRAISSNGSSAQSSRRENRTASDAGGALHPEPAGLGVPHRVGGAGEETGVRRGFQGAASGRAAADDDKQRFGSGAHFGTDSRCNMCRVPGRGVETQAGYLLTFARGRPQYVAR